MPGPHVMLSYQWDMQKLVKSVHSELSKAGITAWMDIYALSANINDSMAEAIQGADVICCFMTQKYQESRNCKKELNYADQCDKIIVPIKAQGNFKATQWLGIITAGLLWIDFRKSDNFSTSVESLIKEIMAQVGGSLIKETMAQVGDSITIMHAEPSSSTQLYIKAPAFKHLCKSSGVSKAIKESVKVKPSRAFKHKQTGNFLAESGDTKYHAASGTRSTLVLAKRAEDTSYWVEERQGKGSSITFFKNYATKGYLGYDPNGDYIYTKKQHYGAEEWILELNEESNTGERFVVLYAKYGKKYLAVINGQFTGVSKCSDDCIWILE